MSEPARFLTSFAQAMATMSLYRDGHPARERAIDASYRQLCDLQRHDPSPRFSFLGGEVVYGQLALRELREWEPGQRLANAGVQRLEFEANVTREDYELFLEELLGRIGLTPVDSAEARSGRPSTIKYGALGIRGEGQIVRPVEDGLPTATITYSLGEEAETIRWMHREVEEHGQLPMLEAESVVRSLAVAMHGDSAMVIPLLQLKEFDEYTTTHSLNVAVLTMALAEYLQMHPADVRAFGVAGLLHDLGKVRVPVDILNKPGKLTEEERHVIQRHPVDGAKIILASEHRLDLAAVVAYEHHIMINGGGYPGVQFARDCHAASKLVHVCDVFDALRTRRPYREAWELNRVLTYIEEKAGTEFQVEIARAFVAMMREWEQRVARIDEATPIAAGGTEPEPAG